MNMCFDKRLSTKAKGLYSIISGLKQNGWEISVSEIQKCCSDGKDSIRSAMNELENNGYLRKEQLKDESGLFYTWNYTILK